jgi:hypothetical protein
MFVEHYKIAFNFSESVFDGNFTSGTSTLDTYEHPPTTNALSLLANARDVSRFPIFLVQNTRRPALGITFF